MSEWISVEERLPEQSVEVLVYDFVDSMDVMFLEVDDDGYRFWADDNGYEYSIHDVTHWMPLPEPPKEG